MTAATAKNNPFKGITDNLQIITNILEEIKKKILLINLFG